MIFLQPSSLPGRSRLEEEDRQKIVVFHGLAGPGHFYRGLAEADRRRSRQGPSHVAPCWPRSRNKARCTAGRWRRLISRRYCAGIRCGLPAKPAEGKTDTASSGCFRDVRACQVHQPSATTTGTRFQDTAKFSFAQDKDFDTVSHCHSSPALSAAGKGLARASRRRLLRAAGRLALLRHLAPQPPRREPRKDHEERHCQAPIARYVGGSTRQWRRGRYATVGRRRASVSGRRRVRRNSERRWHRSGLRIRRSCGGRRKSSNGSFGKGRHRRCAIRLRPRELRRVVRRGGEEMRNCRRAANVRRLSKRKARGPAGP